VSPDRVSAAKAASPRGNFKQRAATTLIAGPIVLLSAYLGGWIFAGVVIAFALVLFFEWDRMVREVSGDAASIVGLGGVTLALVLAAAEWWGATLLAVLATSLAVAALAGHRRGWMAAGVLYAGLGAATLIVVRGQNEMGAMALLWLLLVVWSTDIGAYFSGRTFGGPKLAPAISPNKTWAGFFGGLLAAIVVSLVFSAALRHPWAAHPALTAALVALAVVLGDLLESALKRRFHLKDSGHLLPGHGGVMDRVDGLLGASLLVVGLQLLGLLFLPAAGVAP
jgi:phosphatidate cytidylyltransferase